MVEKSYFERCEQWYARIFKEREIMIRSDGVVRYVRLGSKTQLSVACVLVMLCLWGGAASVTAVWQAGIVSDKRTEIADAKLAISQIKNDLNSYQQEIAKIAQVVKFNREMDNLKDNGGYTPISYSGFDAEEASNIKLLRRKLLASLERIQTDLDLDAKERSELIATRNSLHGRIEELQKSYDNAEIRTKELTQEVLRLEALQEETDQDRSILGNKNADLQVRLANLRAQLVETEKERRHSLSVITSVEHDLDVMRSRNLELNKQRENLNIEMAALVEDINQDQIADQEVASKVMTLLSDLGQPFETEGQPNVLVIPDALTKLEREIRQLKTAKETLEKRDEEQSLLVTQMVETVRSITEPIDLSVASEVAATEFAAGEFGAGEFGVEEKAIKSESDSERAPISADEALAIVSQIAEIHEMQTAILDELSTRTDRDIENIEKIMGMTGVDFEPLMAKAGNLVGMGGPELSQTLDFGNVTELGEGANTLQRRVQRLSALNNILSCTPLISPVDYYQLTSKFGKRRDPITGKRAMHNGVDLAGWPGTKIYATAPGVVKKVGVNGGYGRLVEIDHGCGIVTKYAHMKKTVVKRGQKVDHRTYLGTVGSTGRSTGPHIHYEVIIEGKPVDPMKFIEAGRYVFKG